ncbi:hypothetical protein J4771_02350 [Candidatus Kaistella beijingensis]|uniref:rolling circle replication-associated protein n=1 Tax=Candidatus Kaistella beijingensis TaxID=2820270 RepID=UPI001CC53ADE|nr:hypothetical protein [Candidatus Kaistella beijingensis]UBB90217.1 hypothetical protein J4771_02350 [Candidatus Kaistella beijingensis]
MSIPFLKVKKNCLVCYSLPETKRYNEKSKENLKQFQTIENTEKLKELVELQEKTEIEDVKEFTKYYLLKYEEVKKKNYKRNFSVTQRKKIADSTNTFIDCIKHNYRKKHGFNQRMITFLTLTIPEKQKHTDKVLVKALVDFIDHLKKVKNTLIKDKIDTKEQLLKLENYVWRAETTEAGNIHFHLLFDCYVNHTTLKRVWNNYLQKLGYKGGENAANIHNLKNIKDVGDYVTKYMTKQPLNDEFANLLKSGQISHSDLDNYSDDVKYRRPILYTSWGSSRSLKTLSAPTFSGTEIFDFNELKDKCQKVELKEDLKDYIKIYKGKIYDLLNSCGYKLKHKMKQKFDLIYRWLYDKTDIERNLINELSWLSRQSFDKQIFEPIPSKKNQEKLIIGTLF